LLKSPDVSSDARINLSVTRSRGADPFSEMPGGRALSFQGLSVGETPGPERRGCVYSLEVEGNSGRGQNSPIDKH